MKLLGFLYYFPFVLYIMTALLILFVKTENPYINYIFLQGVAISMSGLHLVLLYSSLYEDGATDTLKYYYRKVVVLDIIRYFIIHSVCNSLLFTLIIGKYGTSFITGKLIIHLFLLFIFFQLIGLALLMATKSIEISISFIVSYTLVEILTLGTFMPWPHLFLFKEPFDVIWYNFTIFSLITGILFSVIQLWMSFSNSSIFKNIKIIP